MTKKLINLRSLRMSLLGVAGFAMALFFSVGLAGAEFQSSSRPKDDIALRVLYSGGIKGNIEPCG